MRKIAVVLTAGALVLISCQPEVTPPSTSTSLPVTTTEPTTTTHPVSTTSTTAGTTSTTLQPHYGPDWYWPESQPDAGGAAGSGCSPGSATLPDGFWFGMAVEHLDTEIVFDLACWFSDPGAENDYRIENDNPTLRTIEVAPGAMVWRVELGSEGGFAAPIPYADWVGNYSVIVSCPGDFCLVWLRTEDGVIQEMVEQYVP